MRLALLVADRREFELRRWRDGLEASLNGHVDVVVLLLAMPEINVNKADDQRYTLLYQASDAGHVTIVKLLLEAPSIKIHAENGYGDTALDIAKENEHFDVVNLFARHGPPFKQKKNDDDDEY